MELEIYKTNIAYVINVRLGKTLSTSLVDGKRNKTLKVNCTILCSTWSKTLYFCNRMTVSYLLVNSNSSVYMNYGDQSPTPRSSRTPR